MKAPSICGRARCRGGVVNGMQCVAVTARWHEFRPISVAHCHMRRTMRCFTARWQVTQPSAMAVGDVVFEHLYGIGTVVHADAAHQLARVEFGTAALRSEREFTFDECKHVLMPTLPSAACLPLACARTSRRGEHGAVGRSCVRRRSGSMRCSEIGTRCWLRHAINPIGPRHAPLMAQSPAQSPALSFAYTYVVPEACCCCATSSCDALAADGAGKWHRQTAAMSRHSAGADWPYRVCVCSAAACQGQGHCLCAAQKRGIPALLLILRTRTRARSPTRTHSLLSCAHEHALA
jgi:hypothetical protein